MKTRNKTVKVASVADVPERRGYNVTLINDEGSYCATQIWDGRSNVMAFVSDKCSAGKDENDAWNRPLVAAFIRPHDGGNTTYEVRFDDDENVALLAVAEAANCVTYTQKATKSTAHWSQVSTMQLQLLRTALANLAAVRAGKAVAS